MKLRKEVRVGLIPNDSLNSVLFEFGVLGKPEVIVTGKVDAGFFIKRSKRSAGVGGFQRGKPIEEFRLQGRVWVVQGVWASSLAVE
jgi:hypothetical protein